MDFTNDIKNMFNKATEIGTELSKTIKNADPNNPESLMQAQFCLTQYSSVISFQSSIINSLKTLVSGIISKI